jgi:RNA polymerase sigma factor (sigma-70 family)
VKYSAREEEWADWMRRALDGDAQAYQRFLLAVTPHLRTMARRRCEQFGAPASEAEDVVQEVLLAVHLKRGTWDPARPIGPWLSAIVRNKLIDSLRRRGRHVSVPIEDVMETVAADDQTTDAMDRLDAIHLLERLKDPQRDIVRSISIGGAGIRETAERLKMSEGAVRVSLHRALKKLAAFYRGETDDRSGRGEDE